jgi:RNA polymerase sigma-70 factor (ECF subfamily)
MDVDIVIRAQGGDSGAFATLAMESARRLNALAVGILRDRELAEDAVQQALVSIWRDLPTLRDPERFDAWSYRVLVRSCYAEARRRRRRLPELLGVAAREPMAPDDYAAVADRDQLARGFARLSLEHRAVVVLHEYLDLPLESVAHVLGIPAGTARSRFHRAIGALRAALEADGRPPGGTAPANEMQGATK